MELFHTTREGDRIAIAQMNDQHLTNMIRMILRRMEACTEVLTRPEAQDPLTKALYGKISKATIADAESSLASLYTLLAPYCLEASLRGLMGAKGDIVPMFQRVAGRSEALPGGPKSLQPCGVGTPPDEPEEDEDWDLCLRGDFHDF